MKDPAEEKNKLLKKYGFTLPQNKKQENTLNNIPLKQVNDYGYILSKNHRKNTINNMANLIIYEREIKSHLLKYLVYIEQKIRSQVVNLVYKNAFSKSNARDIFSFNLYKSKFSNSKKWNAHTGTLIGAINKYKKEEPIMYAKIQRRYGYIPFAYYAHQITFGQLKTIIYQFKKKFLDELMVNLKVVYPEYYIMISILVDLRNSCAHDNNMFLFNAKGFVMPNNVIMSIISKDINKHLKFKGKVNWKNNILAAIIAMKYFLEGRQFSKFSIGYIELCIKISKKMGINKNLSILNGGSNKVIKTIASIKPADLKTLGKAQYMKKRELIIFIVEETGDSESSFTNKTKEELLKYLYKCRNI